MKVTFRQSGGVAGLNEGCELDTAGLSPKEAARLRSLIERSDLASTLSRRTEQARDLCCYEMTVETDDGVHHLSFDEMSLPESLRSLVQYLRSHAKPRQLD